MGQAQKNKTEFVFFLFESFVDYHFNHIGILKRERERRLETVTLKKISEEDGHNENCKKKEEQKKERYVIVV